MLLRRKFWLISAASLIVVALIGSFLASTTVARRDSDTANALFNTASQQIAITLKLGLQHEQDLVVATGAYIASDPNLTQDQFEQWMAATSVLKRYPELLGMAEVIMVPASQLTAFEARAIAEPSGALGPGGTFTVVPPGKRPYYCLANAEVARSSSSPILASLDLCAAGLGPFFLKTRDSGTWSYFPFAISKTKLVQGLIIGTPIYKGGVVPTTVQARRARFIGITGTQVIPDVLLSAALQDHRGMAVTFQYGTNSSKVSFISGVFSGKTQTKEFDLLNGWRVIVAGAPIHHGLWSDGRALTLFLSGLLLGLLLALLVYVLGTGRSRALMMVHERTDQLAHQTLHDALTGLPNRVLIIDRIDQMLMRARRDHNPLALLFLDLDNFKEINDTLGHIAGDQLLVAVGVRLTNVIRTVDTVGRLGGDEFVILVEGASLAPGAEAVAQRILDVLAVPIEIAASHVPLNVSASIGIADEPSSTADEMLRNADIAMYRAKSKGKHRAVMFVPSMQEDVDNQRTLNVDLQSAIKKNEFFLVYQPIVNLATGGFTGVEALLRWRHPLRGVVQPNDFIPALETSGLIVPTGRWVIQEACRQGAAWHRQGHTVTVSVNISARQLEQERIVDDVRDALLFSGFDPNKLILELTETTLMLDVDATIRRLEALKEIGVHLAIDDFGTGYSSLAYLRQFPIDILKIDRSFVSGITNTAEAAALIHTLVQLGKALGLETLAEGIESHEQRLQLIGEQVDTGQGFLFSRPLDVASVSDLLNEWDGSQGVTPP